MSNNSPTRQHISKTETDVLKIKLNIFKDKQKRIETHINMIKDELERRGV